MTIPINQNNLEYNDNEISLKELFLVFWRKKILIGSITSVAAIFSVLYSLSLPNIYTSQSLIAPSNSEDSLSSKLGNFSSLGGLAGISLPSGTASKSQEAIERIKSFEFFSTYFLPNIKLENIMAISEWDPQQDILIYDKKLFNVIKGEWLTGKPSTQEAFKVYKGTISIGENKKTGFVTISIDHESPAIAKKWIDIIIYQINESMRTIDAEAAQRSISFLNETSRSTNVQSIKETVAKLLENQMQTLMLTASNESYVFKIIDSPIVSEQKSKPSRAIICIMGTLLGGMFSLLIVLIQHFRKPNNNYSP